MAGCGLCGFSLATDLSRCLVELPKLTVKNALLVEEPFSLRSTSSSHVSHVRMQVDSVPSALGGPP